MNIIDKINDKIDFLEEFVLMEAGKGITQMSDIEINKLITKADKKLSDLKSLLADTKTPPDRRKSATKAIAVATKIRDRLRGELKNRGSGNSGNASASSGGSGGSQEKSGSSEGGLKSVAFDAIKDKFVDPKHRKEYLQDLRDELEDLDTELKDLDEEFQEIDDKLDNDSSNAGSNNKKKKEILWLKKRQKMKAIDDRYKDQRNRLLNKPKSSQALQDLWNNYKKIRQEWIQFKNAEGINKGGPNEGAFRSAIAKGDLGDDMSDPEVLSKKDIRALNNRKQKINQRIRKIGQRKKEINNDLTKAKMWMLKTAGKVLDAMSDKRR